MYNSSNTKTASPLEWRKENLAPSLRQVDADAAQPAPGAQPGTQKITVQPEDGIRTKGGETSKETNILKEVVTAKTVKNEIFKAALANVTTESGGLKRELGVSADLVEGSGKRFARESAEHRRALDEKITQVNELMRKLVAESEARKLAVEGYRAQIDQLDGELVAKSEALNESQMRIAELEKKIVTKKVDIAQSTSADSAERKTVRPRLVRPKSQRSGAPLEDITNFV